MALQPEQPDRRGGDARARRRALPRLPGHRGRRPGLRRARRRATSRPLVAEHDNLVVARTLLEGLRAWPRPRVGYALAQPALAGALDALRPPGSLSSWSAALARARLRASVEEMRGRLRRGRSPSATRLAAGAARAPASRCDAQAGNFVLARAPVADVFARLAARRLVVRTFGHEPLPGGRFRVTVQRRRGRRPAAAGAGRAGRRRGAAAPPPPPGRPPGRRRRRATKRDRDRLRRSPSTAAGAARVATGLGFLDHMLTALGLLVDARPRPEL